MNEMQIRSALITFANIVECQARIQGMTAENDQRKLLGQSMAYCDKDFFEIAEKLVGVHNYVCEYI